MDFRILGLILFITSNIFSQCPDGNVTFENQSDIDSFSINYPTCSAITGDLIINSESITNLQGLSDIASIGGKLIIYSTQNMVDLSGLEGITEVGGSVDIQSNSALESIKGLDNLKSINGNLEIGYCFNLSDISNLSNLESINGMINFRFLAINSFNGLGKLDYTTITDVSLWTLSNLNSINATSICDYFNHGETGYLADNPEGFNSEVEMQQQCATAGIDQNSSTNIWIYPTPTRNRIIINGINNDKKYHYKLSSIFGNVIIKGTVNDNSQIDLSSLSSGVYYLLLFNENLRIVKTIVKN